MDRIARASYHEDGYRTLEALELLLDNRMIALEEGYRQHLIQHREKEMENENENVEATKNKG